MLTNEIMMNQLFERLRLQTQITSLIRRYGDEAARELLTQAMAAAVKYADNEQRNSALEKNKRSRVKSPTVEAVDATQ